MRRLLALRHAKAVDRDQAPSDAERLLAERGKKDAAALGQLMATRGHVPDRVLCSPSARTRETTSILTRALGVSPAVDYVESLYGGGCAAYGEALAACPDSARTVLLVGHNPSMEDLVATLVGRAVPLGTCCLAVLDLPTDTWRGLTGSGRARLVEVLSPHGASS